MSSRIQKPEYDVFCSIFSTRKILPSVFVILIRNGASIEPPWLVPSSNTGSGSGSKLRTGPQEFGRSRMVFEGPHGGLVIGQFRLPPQQGLVLVGRTAGVVGHYLLDRHAWCWGFVTALEKLETSVMFYWGSATALKKIKINLRFYWGFAAALRKLETFVMFYWHTILPQKHTRSCAVYSNNIFNSHLNSSDPVKLFHQYFGSGG